MICYLDMTFCVSPDCQCERKLTPEIREAAKKWWGGEGAPIAVAEFCSKTPTDTSERAAPNHATTSEGHLMIDWNKPIRCKTTHWPAKLAHVLQNRIASQVIIVSHPDGTEDVQCWGPDTDAFENVPENPPYANVYERADGEFYVGKVRYFTHKDAESAGRRYVDFKGTTAKRLVATVNLYS